VDARVSRRAVLGGLGATLASSITSGAQSTGAATGSPQVQLDMSINLDRDDIYDFILSGKNVQDFEPILTKAENAGYTKLSTRVGGKQELPDKNSPDKSFAAGIPTAKRLTYFVRRKGIIIGEAPVIDVYSNPVIITLSSVLFVANNVVSNIALANKIKTAFDSYDPKADPDPLKYIYSKMGSDVSGDMFIVRAAFSLRKNGSPVALKKQSDFVQDFYAGKVKVVLYKSPSGTWGRYVEEQRLDLVGPKEEDIGRVPTPKPDPHVKELDADPQPTPAQEDAAASSVIEDLMKAAHGPCVFNTKVQERIATIFGWPECEIVMVDVKIKIGCFWVIFSLPVPRFRITSIVLFAFVAHSKEVGHDVVLALTGCLWRSIAAGAIVGLVSWNLPVAIGVFEKCFEECMTYQVLCALPGLALVKESTEWS
jgi:hypothetical protein